MSRPKQAEAVKLLVSLISAAEEDICEAIRILALEFGKPDLISARMPFDYTNYYEEEMGAPLGRRMVSFEKLIPPESLPDVKRMTNDIEDRFSNSAGSRTVNIDPGYLSAAHLILATGKGYTHRPYLRDGIYADLTLMFTGGSFRALPWTYPDYAGADVISLLNRIRDKYLQTLKSLKGENV